MFHELVFEEMERLEGAVVERRGCVGQARFTVPAGGEGVGIGSLFRLLNGSRRELGIEYYSVGQTTMNEVIVRIVREHAGKKEGSQARRIIMLVDWVLRLMDLLIEYRCCCCTEVSESSNCGMVAANPRRGVSLPTWFLGAKDILGSRLVVSRKDCVLNWFQLGSLGVRRPLGG